MTAREMCEATAAAMKDTHAVDVDPYTIFTCSPSGELWPVFALYNLYVKRQIHPDDADVLQPYVLRILSKKG